MTSTANVKSKTTKKTETKAPPAPPARAKKDVKTSIKAVEVDTKTEAPAAAPSTTILPEGVRFVSTGDAELTFLDPAKIEFAPFDSRASDPAIDESLRDSIRTGGVLMPLLLARIATDGGKPRYMVIAGRRRLRVAQEEGLKKVPVHVKPMTEEEALIAAINENVQRRDLTPWDLAMSYKLLRDTGKSQAEIAKMIGKSDGYVSQHLSVFELPDEIQTMVRLKKFEPGTIAKVRELRALKDDPELMIEIARDAVATKDAKGRPRAPWTALEIRETILNRMALAKKRAEAAAKAAATRAERRESASTDETAEEAPETPAPSMFDTIKIEPLPVNKTKLRAWLNYEARRLENERGKEKTDPAKIEYHRGYMDALLTLAGQRKPPVVLADDAE